MSSCYEYQKKNKPTLERACRFGHPERWIVRLLHGAIAEAARSPNLPSGKLMLDYGCGERPYQDLFAAKFEQILGADFPGNTGTDYTVGPLGQLPMLEDGVFDAVLSTQVLEHVADPRVYLAEAYRLLKPGGTLILSTHGMFQYHPDPNDYWRWTRTGLELEIERAGFDVLENKGWFRLPSLALHFWLFATMSYLPHFLWKLYCEFFQFFIGLMERVPMKKNKVVENACFYVVIARKRSDK